MLKPPRSPPRATSSEQKLLLSPKKFQEGERAISEAEGRDPVSTTSHSADPGKCAWQAPTLGPQGSLEFPVPPGLPRPVSDLFTTEDGWCSGMTPCGMDTHWPARAAGGGPGRRLPSHCPQAPWGCQPWGPAGPSALACPCPDPSFPLGGPPPPRRACVSRGPQAKPLPGPACTSSQLRALGRPQEKQSPRGWRLGEWGERAPRASRRLCVCTNAPSLPPQGSSAPLRVRQDTHPQPSSRQVTSRLQNHQGQPGP